MSDLRGALRAVPSITGRAPRFDAGAAPDDPHDLFMVWLHEAIAVVPEPLAMTLSTVDGEGTPDARILVLKDVTDAGAFAFASGAESPKGRQLAVSPVAALTFWWQPLARQVRVRGRVAEAPAADAAADFAARGALARAAALAGTQSTPVSTSMQVVERIAAETAIGDNPRWRLWYLEPAVVEFWQGEPNRVHTRVRYERSASGWTHGILWP